MEKKKLVIKRKYYESTLRSKLKKMIRPLLIEKKALLDEENLLKLNYSLYSSSRYGEIENHAIINFKSLGKNTFINVLYKDRIIYNKSIGKFKINNVKIKKKEKRIKRNLFNFSKEFTDYFFETLKEKFNIKNVSINFISKSSNYYTLKKFFFYKLIGLNYKRSRKTRNLNYKMRKFREVLIKEYPYTGRGSRSRGWSPYESKKPRWYRLNTMAKINKYFHNSKVIKLINVKFINKYPYNGCKKKKNKKDIKI